MEHLPQSSAEQSMRKNGQASTRVQTFRSIGSLTLLLNLNGKGLDEGEGLGANKDISEGDEERT